MQTQIEVQQREDTRYCVAERMKFVLPDLLDSRERARALVKGPNDVREFFSDNSDLSGIFGRVAAPIDLRTSKAESFSSQLIQSC